MKKKKTKTFQLKTGIESALSEKKFKTVSKVFRKTSSLIWKLVVV